MFIHLVRYTLEHYAIVIAIVIAIAIQTEFIINAKLSVIYIIVAWFPMVN